jgi:hypothetical protein
VEAVTAKIFAMPGPGDIDPTALLEMAKGQCSELVIIGVDSDGDLAIWSTTGDMPRMNWWLTLAQEFLIRQVGK